jgi:hypothetical protein
MSMSILQISSTAMIAAANAADKAVHAVSLLIEWCAATRSADRESG